MTVGASLCRAGRLLHVQGNLIGRGRIDGTSARGNGDDELVAVGVLLQVGGELTVAAVPLLSSGQHYAGAALVRQIVEVEYLMWAFASKPADATAWLNSTARERMTFFKPSELRKRSKGRFNHADYGHHCELGGHPVPRASSLVGGGNNPVVQLLLTDILLHGWRTLDSAVEWSVTKGVDAAVRGRLEPVHAALAAWSKADPLYGQLPAVPRNS
jgi:hypothetical protein